MLNKPATEKLKPIRAFLPGSMLICLGMTIAVFPQSLPWVLAVLLVVSGVAAIQAVRLYRAVAESIRNRLIQALVDQLPEDNAGRVSVEGQGHPVSWVN